ncbi:transcriptional regulator, HxlR family [Thermobispora bispora DSM 43833]|uniref:Transcriptional regulator, HxlR family n=2 Tax=Thermobispora bispora TaxID=2006 RepID=D6Y2F1_THEBD|nr:transcriptional regulator, HxlR family [Thermobispora bispora DSM 43833]
MGPTPLSGSDGRRNMCEARRCSKFHQAVELIGARWSGAIIHAIFTGRHRYAELKAAIAGVSDTMLSQRLRRLEGEGIIERRVIPSTPVQVEYHLTDKGKELEPVIEALTAWAEKWITLEEPGGGRQGEAAPARPGDADPGSAR